MKQCLRSTLYMGCWTMNIICAIKQMLSCQKKSANSFFRTVLLRKPYIGWTWPVRYRSTNSTLLYYYHQLQLYKPVLRVVCSKFVAKKCPHYSRLITYKNVNLFDNSAKKAKGLLNSLKTVSRSCFLLLISFFHGILAVCFYL